jgi:hypothetical protein
VRTGDQNLMQEPLEASALRQNGDRNEEGDQNQQRQNDRKGRCQIASRVHTRCRDSRKYTVDLGLNQQGRD